MFWGFFGSLNNISLIIINLRSKYSGCIIIKASHINCWCSHFSYAIHIFHEDCLYSCIIDLEQMIYHNRYDQKFATLVGQPYLIKVVWVSQNRLLSSVFHKSFMILNEFPESRIFYLVLAFSNWDYNYKEKQRNPDFILFFVIHQTLLLAFFILFEL